MVCFEKKTIFKKYFKFSNFQIVGKQFKTKKASCLSAEEDLQ